MVPYIDVMLVLLVIFMVTAPMLTQGVQVDLPRALAEAITDNDATPPLIVSVDGEGKLYLNTAEEPDQPLDEQLLLAQIVAEKARRPDRSVLVKGDRRVPYDEVIRTLSALRAAGITSVGLMTQGY